MAVSRVCVFCGSLEGHDSRYLGLGVDLGRLLAEAGLQIVYGGGGVGIMGAVADSAIAAGGHVTGIIPSFLVEREHHHPGVARMIETRDMHERRMAMYDNADAFISLPGGIGTLEETVEVVSWITLDIHTKPVILVDSAYWSPFVALLEHMDGHGFSHRSLKDCVDIADAPADAVARLVAGTS
ncbi:MAG: TIGR00730 family Rossman fold protein [bacterium]|nr:TIGR00730 family Rossman fold protein [bacterium]